MTRLFIITFALLLTSAVSQVVNITMHGAIVSAQIMCTAPCSGNEALAITRTNYIDQVGVPNNVVLQELLPPADKDIRTFESYTAYHEKSRSFLVVAAEFPRIDSATFWVSTLNNDITVAKPVYTEVVVDYLSSTAPFPLNILHLKMSRVFFDNDGIVYASFSNGEIHRIDLETKTFKKLISVIPESQILSNSYPRASWSQVYDPDTNGIWSVVTQGSEAFAVKFNLADSSLSEWLPLTQPQGIHADFSPDTFLTAHMMKVQDGQPAQLCVMIESLDDVGFDEILFVDTSSGKLINVQANLMEFNVVLQCPQPLECDKKRVSAYDPVDKKLYFQGHAVDPNNGMTTLGLFYLYFFESKITGKLESVVDPAQSITMYGYSGFQFVQYA